MSEQARAPAGNGHESGRGGPRVHSVRMGRAAAPVSRFLSEYGMLLVLLALCTLFSVLTIREQHRGGTSAADALAHVVLRESPRRVVVVARSGGDDLRFADRLAHRLQASGKPLESVVIGDPPQIREAFEHLDLTRGPLAVATLEEYAPVVRAILQSLPAQGRTEVLTPTPYRWPTFLLAENLVNVANQIAVIALIAIGMTMVIITGGIDLSVGSLVALAAVITTGLIGRLGGETASGVATAAAAASAVILCGVVGAFSGLVITRFRIPPFIATLAMMQVGSGVAYIISRGRPIYEVPDHFVTLGRGTVPVVGIPYAVLLMVALYVAAHVLMSRTTLGRYVYAVGGNAEAARLAGVRVHSVVMFVFIASGMLAGLGGVVMSSQLKSGAPTYGIMYELYVIAAVVVGGTSLSGGEGRVFGTLIGALIIAVIQNGMNLTNVESYSQKVVLGLVILTAVLLDRMRHREWFWQRRKLVPPDSRLQPDA